jgi:cytochrome c
LLVWASPFQTAHSASLSGLNDQAHGLPVFAAIQLTQSSLAPTPFFNPTATPPTEGGHGKDVFYLRCMSCHGDRGQGLTDEFRNRVYPPDDTNCWKSGCHGAHPYENGFTLPRQVPALIGPGTLSHFNTAQDVYNFIHHAMPFDAPGALSEEQYLQVLAFILESNQIIPAGSQLDAASLASIALRATSATPTPSGAFQPAGVFQPAESPTPVPFFVLGGVIIAGLAGLALWLLKRR